MLMLRYQAVEQLLWKQSEDTSQKHHIDFSTVQYIILHIQNSPSIDYARKITLYDYITTDPNQGLLQFQAWVPANGVLKDCMPKPQVDLGNRGVTVEAALCSDHCSLLRSSTPYATLLKCGFLDSPNSYIQANLHIVSLSCIGDLQPLLQHLQAQNVYTVFTLTRSFFTYSLLLLHTHIALIITHTYMSFVFLWLAQGNSYPRCNLQRKHKSC